MKTLITCIVELRNVGADSVAMAWHLKQPPRQMETQGVFFHPCKLTAETVTLNSRGNKNIQFFAEDNLLDRAMVPIPRGGVIHGFLHFLTPVPKEVLADLLGPNMELCFRDILDTPYSTSGSIAALPLNENYYFPGMKTTLVEKIASKEIVKTVPRRKPKPKKSG